MEHLEALDFEYKVTATFRDNEPYKYELVAWY
jgi:hypothetical protein